MRILDERQGTLVNRERALMERFIGFLKDFGAPSEDVELVRRALSDLEELFLLVIVGEFNSGKSAFINALLGAEISEEGVTPTTNRITVLRHSPEPVQRERRDGVLEKGYPNAFLHEIAIVDTPLGVVEELDRRYRAAVDERLNLLEEDFRTSENVESQLKLYKEDMERDFEARMAEIQNIIHSLNERGDAWLEENVRLMNFRELLRQEKVRERFKREVVADSEDLIDERVDELIDWMVDRNLKQWHAIVEYVNRRRQAEYDEQLIGEVGDGFEYNRGQ